MTSNMSTVSIRVTRQGEQFIGECLDFPVMTHGRTVEELGENMEKAINLFLAGKGPSKAAEKAAPEEIVSLEVNIPTHADERD